MKNSSKKYAYIGLSVALAMILSYVELLLPPVFVSVPGIKMGLPNIVIIYILYRFGFGYASFVSLIRVFLVSLLFGNVLILFYSIAGAVLSILVMYLLKRSNMFSVVSVSVVGAIMHNLAQILVAVLVLGTLEIGYYMIVLTITGTISGTLVGLVGVRAIKKI